MTGTLIAIASFGLAAWSASGGGPLFLTAIFSLLGVVWLLIADRVR